MLHWWPDLDLNHRFFAEEEDEPSPETRARCWNAAWGLALSPAAFDDEEVGYEDEEPEELGGLHTMRQDYCALATKLWAALGSNLACWEVTHRGAAAAAPGEFKLIEVLPGWKT